MTFDAIKAHILRLDDDGQPDPADSEDGGPQQGDQQQLSNVESLFAGSFAGFVSCTCTYPLDLARARLAVERTPGAAAGGAGAAGGAAGAGAGRGMGSRTAHSVLYIFQAAYSEGVRRMRK